MLDEIQVPVIHKRCDVRVLLIEVICKTRTGTFANSANPDQTPQNAASDRCLYCLLELQDVKGK